MEQIHRWHFDQNSSESKSANYVEVNQDCEGLTLYLDGDVRFTIGVAPDQWGTFIELHVHGHDTMVVCQESGTRSFIDAMIAGLTKIRDIANHGDSTLPPTEVATQQDSR